MRGFSEFDIRIIQQIQAFGEWLLPIMKFFTAWGYTPVYFMLIMLYCWCWDYRFGIRLAMFTGFSGALNDLLKIFFRAPRPYMVDERVMKYGTSKSFGMPSGHAQGAASFWGYFSAHTKSLVFRIAALLMIFFIGVSRIYLGVHSPLQVLSGWILGFGLVGIFLFLERKASGWWSAQRTSFQIFIILDMAVLLVLLALLKLYFYRDMTEFIYTTSRKHVLGIISMASLLAGIGVGGVLFTKKYQVSVQCSPGKQALKILIALCSLAGFLFFLVFAKTLQAQLIQVSLFLSVAGIFVGSWIAYFAPLLFLRFGLFEKI